MKLDLQIIVLVLSGLTALVVAYFAWGKRPTPGSVAVAALMLGLSFWVFGEAMYATSPNYPAALFWENTKFWGITSVPVLMFVLTLEYTRKDAYFQKTGLWPLAIFPLLTVLMAYTDQYHHLFRATISYEYVNNFSVLTFRPGIWYWLHTVYSYTLLLLSLILLLMEHIRLPGYYRKQTLSMLIGMLLPWGINILFVFKLIEGLHIDITPPALVLGALMFFWGMFRLNFLDLLPIAKESVLESMLDPVIVVDTQDRVVDVNRATYRLLQDRKLQLLGRNLYELYRSLPEYSDEMEKLIREENKFLINLNGEKKIFAIKTSQILSRNTVLGRTISLRDITRMEKALHELEEARKAAEAASLAKGDFLATLSHEIKTPINGVLGMVEHLISHEENPQTKKDLQTVESSVQILVDIINDILDNSKLEAGKFELENIWFNLPELVSSTCEFFSFQAQNKGLRLECRIENEVPPEVNGDPIRLRQILSNLINNSLKFTSQGSVAVLVSCPEPKAKLQLVTFRIKDTGIGIPPEKAAKIFERFQQADSSTSRKYGGTGLGLAIVKDLVMTMKGSIEVNTQCTQGSEFIVQIPFPVVSCNTRQTTSIQTALEELGKKDLHLIICDDNSVNRTILEKFLQGTCWKVETAANGSQALTKLRSATFDLLITDINMPEMDGYELTSIIRRDEAETGRHLPIIALTADSLRFSREDYLLRGMDDYLTKPVSKDKLFAAIARVIKMRG